ncbi:MAG TPA: hypothetical protein VJ302_14580 [Blastocatellia bacterium]|nr:hypothetical protein [Blastocatellia bacterium]
MPLLRFQPSSSVDSIDFPGWPTVFEGRELKPVPLSEREERLTRDFPGKIARFSDGSREIIIRWVTGETRALHPASDCFRGLGYAIKPLPVKIDPAGHQWGSFSATRRGETLRVSERIYSASDPGSWIDVSSWYWNATLGRTKAPWWTVTVAESESIVDGK